MSNTIILSEGVRYNPIILGQVNDNLTKTLLFDISYYTDLYGEGTVAAVFTKQYSSESVILPNTSVADSILTVPVTSEMTETEGRHKLSINYWNDDGVSDTLAEITTIATHLYESSSTPTDYSTWIQQSSEKLEKVDEALEDLGDVSEIEQDIEDLNNDLKEIETKCISTANAEVGDVPMAIEAEDGTVTWEWNSDLGSRISAAEEAIKNMNTNQGILVISEDMVTVEKTKEKGTEPYDTSYYYTDITVTTDTELTEGLIINPIVISKMVVSSSYRNVRIRFIGSEEGSEATAWIPVCGSSGTILSGSSYFTKSAIRMYQYSTKYIESGAFLLLSDSNSTYKPATLGGGYGSCSTADDTALTAELSSYALVVGGCPVIKFTIDVPADATLNINGKGAKPIWYKDGAITDGIISAGDTVTFCYGGTYYHVTSIDAGGGGIDASAATEGQVLTADGKGGYSWEDPGTSVDLTPLITATESDIGLFPKVKAVSDGKVTEWEFVEVSGGGQTYSVADEEDY